MFSPYFETSFDDCVRNRCRIDRTRVKYNVGTLGCEINCSTVDTRRAVQRLLQPCSAGATRHAIDWQTDTVSEITLGGRQFTHSGFF